VKQANGIMAVALALALSLAAHAQPGDFHDGPGGPGGQGDHGGIGMAFNPHMMHELHLSPDQERKLKEDRLAAQKKKIQLHSEKAMLELDLKNILSTYPVKKADAMKLADKIADVEKRMTLQKVENMTQLLGSLTAEQHAKLMELQDEFIEKRKAWKEEMQSERRQFKKGTEGKDDKGENE
jgi:Spy/CpxP family protein refolding chaperone